MVIRGRQVVVTLGVLLAGCGGDKRTAGGGADKEPGAASGAARSATDAAPASLWRAVAQPAGGKDLEGVWGTGAELFIVGAGGTILHSSDRGQTWTAQSSGTDAWLSGVWGVDAEHVWVAGARGVVLRTDNGGASWSPVDIGLSPVDLPVTYVNDVWGGGEKTVHVVGRGELAASGNLLQSFDGGRKWKRTGSGNPPLWFNGVWGNGAGELFVVGNDGLAMRGFVMHSTDGGKSFARSPMEFNDLHAVWGDGAGAVYAVGCTGSALVSSDGGRTWEMFARQGEYASVCFSDVWTGSGGVYVVGGFGTILHQATGASDWVAEPTAGNQGLRSVWGGDGEAGSWVIVVGEAGTVLRSP